MHRGHFNFAALLAIIGLFFWYNESRFDNVYTILFFVLAANSLVSAYLNKQFLESVFSSETTKFLNKHDLDNLSATKLQERLCEIADDDSVSTDDRKVAKMLLTLMESTDD